MSKTLTEERKAQLAQLREEARARVAQKTSEGHVFPETIEEAAGETFTAPLSVNDFLAKFVSTEGND